MEPGLRLNLFDLSGKPEYVAVRQEFYADAQALLLVFDVTSQASFDALPAFVEELHAHMSMDQRAGCLMVVCGAKSDAAARIVAHGTARLWAENNGFHYFDTSACSGLPHEKNIKRKKTQRSGSRKKSRLEGRERNDTREVLRRETEARTKI